MRVEKNRPPLRKRINVRRLNLRMSVKTSDPIILIVDGYKQNIGLIGGSQMDSDRVDSYGLNRKHKEQQHETVGSHDQALHEIGERKFGRKRTRVCLTGVCG